MNLFVILSFLEILNCQARFSYGTYTETFSGPSRYSVNTIHAVLEIILFIESLWKTIKLLSPFKINDQQYEPVQLILNQGTIEGRRLKDVDIYRGIPYANTPSRFAMAEGVDSWGRKSVKNTKEAGPSCYQLGFDPEAEDRGEISEDCLTVDIYIPRTDDSSTDDPNLGIIVWIHGGGFQTGDAKYYSGIEQAVNYGNIVVLVQYRLGIFGFFNYKDNGSGTTIGGNYALGDMAIAVKFISENAQNLGGNPGNIILNGQSAGSGAVMALLLHDDTASLISGAFAQSGPTIPNFVNGAMDETVPRRICAAVQAAGSACDASGDIQSVVDSLKSTPPSVLLANSLGENYFEFTWIPVADDGVFYKEDALEKYLDRRVNTGFELVIGFNSYEGGLTEGTFNPPGVDKPDFQTSYDTIVALYMIEKGLEITNKIFNTNYNNQTYMEKLRADWTVYGSDYKSDITKFDEFLTAQMLGDVNYRLPSIVDAMTYTNAGVKTYLYYQDIGENFMKYIAPSEYGTPHGAELISTFGAFRNEKNGSPETWEIEIAEIFGSKISSLVNYDPNISTTIWHPFSDDEAFTILRNSDTHAHLTTAQGIQSAQNIKSEYAEQYWQQIASCNTVYNLSSILVFVQVLLRNV